MAHFSIDTLPGIFSDSGGQSAVTEITLGKPLFIQPVLVPDDPSTSLTGLDLTFTIKQLGNLYSFLREDGKHYATIVFEDFVTVKDILKLTLIGNGEKDPASLVTFKLECTGPSLDPKTKTIAYGVK